MTLRSYTLQAFASLKLPREPWLIPGLLPGGGWTLLMAPSKAGKSLLALQLVDALVSGSRFLGFPCHQTPRVYYIQADAPISDWQGQVQALTPTSQARTIILSQQCLSIPGLQADLTGLLKREQATFVVWDALYKLGTWDLNTPDGTRTALQTIKNIHPGIPFLLIHHVAKWTTRPEGIDAGVYAAAGSFTLVSDASTVWGLRQNGLTVTGRTIRTMTLPIKQGEGGRWERLGAAPVGGLLGL